MSISLFEAKLLNCRFTELVTGMGLIGSLSFLCLDFFKCGDDNGLIV